MMNIESRSTKPACLGKTLCGVDGGAVRAEPSLVRSSNFSSVSMVVRSEAQPHRLGWGLNGTPNRACTAIGFWPMSAALNLHRLSASMAR